MDGSGTPVGPPGIDQVPGVLVLKADEPSPLRISVTLQPAVQIADGPVLVNMARVPMNQSMFHPINFPVGSVIKPKSELVVLVLLKVKAPSVKLNDVGSVDPNR